MLHVTSSELPKMFNEITITEFCVIVTFDSVFNVLPQRYQVPTTKKTSYISIHGTLVW